jgi:DNA-binding NtrC family response regulator
MRRLRDLDPGVRAIVASGYSNDPVVAHATSYGFVAEVSKPFGMRDLTQTLERVLSGAEVS